MKRYTTRKGTPKIRQEAIKVWERCWKELKLEQIQAWIKSIPWHIKQIIELGGGMNIKRGGRKGWRPDM